MYKYILRIEETSHTVYTLGPGILPSFHNDSRETMTLGEIVASYENIYCGSYGVKLIYISDGEKCDQICKCIETTSSLNT